MRINERKLVALALVAVVAISGAMAPRISQASPDDHAILALVADTPTDSRCDHDVGGDADRASHAQGWPNHNCCGKSCAPIAFIFNSLSIDALTMVGSLLAVPQMLS